MIFLGTKGQQLVFVKFRRAVRRQPSVCVLLLLTNAGRASAAATNTPPTITAPTNYVAMEDVSLPIDGILVGDADAGTNAIQLTVTVSSLT